MSIEDARTAPTDRLAGWTSIFVIAVVVVAVAWAVVRRMQSRMKQAWFGA